MVFDNQRILHGRTAFSSARFARHLRGCYLSRDSVYSETALLRRQLDDRARMSVAAEVMSLYERRGAGAYFGERVSMT